MPDTYQAGGASIPTAPVTILPDQTLTASYVFSSIVDTYAVNSVSIGIDVGTAQPGTSAYAKFQWSGDGVIWFDEPVLTAGTVSGTEQPFTYATRVVTIDLGLSTNNYPERFNRFKRYFRVGVKSSGSTTGTISITAETLAN